MSPASPFVSLSGAQGQAAQPELALRDIHHLPAPPWWPPAPGWWLLLALVLVILALAAGWWLRRRHRHAAAARLFDQRIGAASTPVARVAAMSELLRRAARLRDPAADRLQGDAWLQFLDGDSAKGADARQPFSQGPGRLLLDGGFRRAMAAEDVDALQPLARNRYLQLMAVRR